MTINRLSQPMLELIASRPDGITTAEVCEQLGRAHNLVTTTAVRLKRRRLIEVPETGLYRISDEGRIWLASGRAIAPGQGRRRHERSRGLRERAWWLMRELRKFTLTDLLTTLADGSERRAADNLRKYLTALERAGIVQRMRRRVAGTALTSNGHVLWWLKHDLGRKPPVWRPAHGTVFDPNTGDTLPLDREEVRDV